MKWLYLFRAEGSSFYKIGITEQDPEDRLDTLQTGCPYDLSLDYAVRISEAGKHEALLHEEFSASQKRGEWFEFDSDGVEEVRREMERLIRHEGYKPALEGLEDAGNETLEEAGRLALSALRDLIELLEWGAPRHSTKAISALAAEGLINPEWEDRLRQADEETVQDE